MLWLLAVALSVWSSTGASGPTPRIAYTLSIDSAAPSVAHVSIALENVPASFHLAMKVHAEYDARYWRFLDSLRIDDATGGAVSREDSTLWRVQLPGGRGTVRYVVHLQPPARFPSGVRRVWMPFARADGAMINPPDFFLYIPELATDPVSLTLAIPASWQVATALASEGAPTSRRAPDARTLLDSPLLLGALRTWSFAERGATFHVEYWPEPNASVFDDTAFVNSIHRLATQALAVFGGMPTKDYWFLLEDGAGDALEHGASVPIGITSAHLAADPHSGMTELAHEFFHTWNLVAIRPAGYNELAYRPPPRTPSLWIGEGITIYYADVLQRRAALTNHHPERSEGSAVPDLEARDDRLARLLGTYYSLPALQRVSPSSASLAFPDSRTVNPDATGGYYIQGELLAFELDAVIRDSTKEARSLDDVMRAMYVASQRPGYNGYSPDDFERAADSVCACRLDRIFDGQVRNADPIGVTPVLRRIGYRMLVDTLPATPSPTGPRLNVRMRFVDADSVSAGARAKRLEWLAGR